MAGRDELIGSDVIVAHRLLKNHVVEQLGLTAYALITQAGIDAVGLDPAVLGMTPCSETYEAIGPVSFPTGDMTSSLSLAGRASPSHWMPS
jgi:hypothetical protein